MTDDVSGQESNTNPTGDDQEANAGGEGNDTLLTGKDGEQDGAGSEGNQDGNEGNDQENDGEDKGDEGDVPEAYEFKMPDGMELDKAMADAATPIFKELGLNQEQASKLVEVYANQIGAQATAQQDAFNDQLETWVTELKNDKEVGGEAYEKNTGIARQAIEKFGSDELMELMDSTGIGSNPAMFKFALKVGKFLVEDQPGSGDAAQEESTIENRMYPNEAAN